MSAVSYLKRKGNWLGERILNLRSGPHISDSRLSIIYALDFSVTFSYSYFHNIYTRIQPALALTAEAMGLKKSPYLTA
jgi:hypothetical protein